MCQTSSGSSTEFICAGSVASLSGSSTEFIYAGSLASLGSNKGSSALVRIDTFLRRKQKARKARHSQAGIEINVPECEPSAGVEKKLSVGNDGIVPVSCTAVLDG